MIYRKPVFSITPDTKPSYSILKERVRLRISKGLQALFKLRSWFMIVLFIGGFIALIGLTWHHDHVREELERKDCQQFRDIAQRDTPMRCMHYWAHHHND